ncbi:oxygen-independent coproporphyrinogen III oxidase [Pseudoteredinibacter isoporae]|uniref:Coproporphyrinogen-III oxidase n=1 Tax=Pseudoteredinibacter isoporae TaxID=570281 RepID=A0A7X0JV06_9GAMM|nr:oxygen-independent coproporphyrinogen III oxidase [Pseudoteredinibacter isoporae]MBB6522777.1 oxygen-independent coproporphyrinogen-3 oxidase [Pseudoteredinibacter isoporae]NHO88304.1 oxygen-independent coproporphyrinogen III oxidase [Pseudoteredinibacter isoporae]NIB23365.1 oxygen-independent coproporphyrinogen III oxidase [Pseudoteredinibacter isoporae]
MTDISWDESLIKRHDLAGPRYTSYPTAPQFHDEFGPQELKAAIDRSNEAARPLSLYMHIPFCDTICYYCGCNKIVTANKKRAQPYLDKLHQEISRVAQWVDSGRKVKQLHWGGGTPTYISHQQMRELMTHSQSLFEFSEDGEYSIELHPGTTNQETISLLKDIGFNRLSMGVQDFDPKVQTAVNRFNSVEEVQALVDQARQDDFDSISMDLIYGLPFQNCRTLAETLDKVIQLGPDRLSLFNYAHLPHLFKTQRQMDAEALPPAEEKLAMLHLAIDTLTRSGYQYIGMDHFAKPDDELCKAQYNGSLQRNFQGYATYGGCDMFAFGVSSISAIDNIFVQNHKDIPSYSKALEQERLPISKGLQLSQDDLLRQHIINRLICQFELDFNTIGQRFSIDFQSYFAKELLALQPLLEDGLLSQLDHNSLQVSPAGRLIIRRVCMVFDAYLPALQDQALIASSTQPRYSKII